MVKWPRTCFVMALCEDCTEIDPVVQKTLRPQNGFPLGQENRIPLLRCYSISTDICKTPVEISACSKIGTYFMQYVRIRQHILLL